MSEADADLLPDVFDDMYLNMELEIPRDGDGPDFAKGMKCLREKYWIPMDHKGHTKEVHTSSWVNWNLNITVYDRRDKRHI